MWCIERGVSHAHCPLGCEHPQPFIPFADTSRLLCGGCYFVDNRITDMAPCLPETCRDA